MQAPVYDILLQGGWVLDPANSVNGVCDVALAGGRIAAVAADIPLAQARHIVPVTGLYVVPGLIDLHMHTFGYKGSLRADVHALPNGATTIVDAGGPGWQSVDHFYQEVVLPSQTRILAFLNIVGPGMIEEFEQDIEQMQPEPTAEALRRYPDLLVGVKLAHYFGPGFEAVDRAVEAGRLAGKPIMVDTRLKPTRPYREFLLDHLRPGDMHTHIYAEHIPLLDEQKRVNDYVWQARERGVLFDVGHGAGSLWFRVAVPALAQGFWPDTISTDLHRDSSLLPNAALNAVMSKFLNMGLSLSDVISRVTVAPARVIGHPKLGTLSVGAEADVAVLQLEEGLFRFMDSGHARLHGTRRLSCLLTIRAGQVVWDPTGLAFPDWETAGDYGFWEGNGEHYVVREVNGKTERIRR